MEGYIINPKTGRAIKLGGKTWIKVVNEGLLPDDFDDPNIICDMPDSDAEEKIAGLNENLVNYSAVAGRGKYAGKIIKRRRPIAAEKAVRKTARIAEKICGVRELEEKILAELLCPDEQYYTL